MAKVVCLNTDAPTLKTKGPSYWDQLFGIQYKGDYITFAGRREIRAWIVTASNGYKAFEMEFPDNNALSGWLLDSLGLEPEDVSHLMDQIVSSELLTMNYFMDEEEIQAVGFTKPGKPFSPPRVF